MDLLRAALEVGLVYAILGILKSGCASVGQVAVMTLARGDAASYCELLRDRLVLPKAVQVFFAAMFDIDVPGVLLSALIIRVIELGWLGLVSILLMNRLIGKMGTGAGSASLSRDQQSAQVN